MNIAETWLFLIAGYALTITIEIPILLLGLSKQVEVVDRIKLGFILTAITYPIVVLVLPSLIAVPLGYITYLVFAETFAPLAEIACFRILMKRKLFGRIDQDACVIAAANLCSFLIGWAFLGNWIQKAIQSL